jgi:glucose/arabinose dehydrogenase
MKSSAPVFASLLVLLLATPPAFGQTSPSEAAAKAAEAQAKLYPKMPRKPPSDAAPGTCEGKERPALDAIKTAEGLVIAPDGTLYFTQPFGAGSSGFLGRYKPPYEAPELQWVDLGGKALGITIDPKRAVLYAGSRDRKKLLAVTLSERPLVMELADVEPTINGVTLGPDDAVYYTDQKGGHVYRVTAQGQKTQVTTSPLEDLNGLAFGPDGQLYVLTFAKAKITRLKIAGGKEKGRVAFAEITGARNADGITFDKNGRLYVTAGALFRVSADGKKVESLGAAYGANADFGVGALACSDLYTAGNGKGIARVENDTQGLDVPWHRPKVKIAEKVPAPSPPPAVPAKIAAKIKLERITEDTTDALGLVAVPGEPVGRLFIVEKQGPIRILRGKAFAPKPFLDLTGKVSLWKRPNSEQGLLSLAFHPQYLKNGRFFVHYTDLDWKTRVVEYRVSKDDPDRADPASARDLLVLDQPYDNHNGGNLEFGPDGKLYVLLGDGGAGGDPHYLAQNQKTLLGKMLRFDVDAEKPAPEVLGAGLRNPWRYSFDRKTGDLYIAEVGQNLFEYIHFVPARRLAGPHNFGWNTQEGKHCFQAARCNRKGFVQPVMEYPHSEGCSLTGGYAYRGKALPELAGHYFYSDYCTAILRSFRIKNGKAVESWDWKAALDPDNQIAQVTAFGEDQEGEMYVVTHAKSIFKLARRSASDPPLSATAANR